MKKYFHSFRLFWNELYWFVRWLLIGSIILSLLFFKSSSVILIGLALMNLTRIDSYYENGKKLRISFPSRLQLVQSAVQFIVPLWVGSLSIYFLSKVAFWRFLIAYHPDIYQDIRFVYAITTLMVVLFPNLIAYMWEGKKEDWAYTVAPLQASVTVVAFVMMILPVFLPMKYAGIILTLASGFFVGILLLSVKKIQEFLA